MRNDTNTVSNKTINRERNKRNKGIKAQIKKDKQKIKQELTNLTVNRKAQKIELLIKIDDTYGNYI